MPIQLQCRCGSLQGEIDEAGTYARATCYCKDCRAYANWLGTPGLLDERGGTDIVAMAPSRLRLTRGQEHLACMTLTGRVLRWYTTCCRSPVGNTASDPGLHYVGVPVSSLRPEAAITATLGPEGRCVANTGSATAPVRPTPLALARAGARVAAGVLGARMRRQRASPFFEPSTGRPVRPPMPRHAAGAGDSTAT
jgi:hypothetical protein